MNPLATITVDSIARMLLWAGTFALFTPFELLFPQGRRQILARRLQGLVFWIISVVATTAWFELFGYLKRAGGVHAVVHLDLQRLSSWAGPAAGVVSVVLAAAIGDLIFYWYHRAQHSIPWLWRFHAVHHSIRDMSAVNSYHHVTETIFQSAFSALPLAWLAIDHGDIRLLSTAFALQVVAIHCPTRLHLGPLRCVLADNRFHRIHHSLEERHFDKNFAANFTFWDRLFGTAYFPKAGEWPDTGLAETPEPGSVAAWIALPFAKH